MESVLMSTITIKTVVTDHYRRQCIVSTVTELYCYVRYVIWLLECGRGPPVPQLGACHLY